ncbi:conserved hypothetical protein [Xanthomonas citri pv. citri]|nr:conserved hypothetical protein [Xanthomonas citri pv. citri]
MGLNVCGPLAASVNRWALLAADWIHLRVFLLPARAPFLHRRELAHDDGLAGAHRLGGLGWGVIQRLSGVSSTWWLLLAVNDQFASGGPGVTDIALAHQRFVRKRLAHQTGEQLAGDFELLGMGGHEELLRVGEVLIQPRIAACARARFEPCFTNLNARRNSMSCMRI